jgi:cell division protein FtsB
MEAAILFWLTVVSVLWWPGCFWMMQRISSRQNALLRELREHGKRIEELSKEEHQLIKQVHRAVEEIREGVAEAAKSQGN